MMVAKPWWFQLADRWGTTFGWSFPPNATPKGAVSMTDSTSGPDGRPNRLLHLVETPTGDRPLDPPADGAAVSPAVSTDAVINLREAGRTYAAIARELTMSGSVQAQAAFVRAVRHRPQQERSGLIERELGRLDNLERKIRARTDQDPNRSSQHLGALEKLRSALR